MKSIDKIKELKQNITMLAMDFPFSMPFVKYDIVLSKEKTASVDGVRLYVNYDFYESLNRFERNGVLLHEWWHIAKLDCSNKRIGYRNRKIWNFAADFWINNGIYKERNSCIELPKGCLVDESFDGMNTEQIYNELVKLMQQRKGDKDAINQTSKERANSKYCDKNRAADILNNEVKDDDVISDDIKPQPIDFDEDAVLKDVLTGLEFQKKTRGNLSGNLQMLLEHVKSAKADWRKILASLFRQVQHFGGSRSFSNPKKWSWCYKICLPGEIGKKKISTTLVIDVSGSMLADDTLSKIASEVSGIIPHSYDCTVLTADTEVKQKIKIKNLKQFIDGFNKSKGGGGTSFVDALKQCETIDSDITLFFTDGYGEYGDSVPKIKNLVWVFTEKCEKPPFGKYIYMT